MFSLGKIFVFWVSILILAAMLHGLLPINDYSWVTEYALLVVATLALLHTSCASIYSVCCWILKKCCPYEMKGFRSEDFAVRSSIQHNTAVIHTPH